MSVSVSYFYLSNATTAANIPGPASSPDAVSLPGGSVALIGDDPRGLVVGGVLDGSGVQTGTISNQIGGDGSIARLANGHLVIATQDPDSVVFRVVDSITGTVVVAETDLGAANESNPDVAGLTGGRFVIVDQRNYSPTDNDIEIWIRNPDGSASTSFVLNGTSADDRNASVAALDDGNFAVAWQRNVGGASQIWYAVYNPNGVAVKTAGPLDATGTVNARPSVTAANGGFAIAYEDNEWDQSGTGNADITLARFDFAGSLIARENVAMPDTSPFPDDPPLNRNDYNAYATRMSNGMLVVAHGRDWALSPPAPAVLYTLVDPAAGVTTHFAWDYLGDFAADGRNFAAVADGGMGRLNLFWVNSSTGEVNGRVLPLGRLVNGDDANDSYVGDLFVDQMLGFGGDDTLSGAGNNDSLFGMDGGDVLFGDDGDDSLAGGNDNDLMSGGTGNDTLDGEAGSDTMQGATGNDTYFIDDAGDVVIETYGGSAGGTDTIISQVSYTLPADVERLTLTGSAIAGNGNASKNRIVGNGLDNALRGDDGNDTLIGGDGADELRGAAGDDLLSGGNGNDSYFVDSSGDAISETNSSTGSGGLDTVYSQIDWTLGNNLEDLRLQGAGNLAGTGNVRNNLIAGNTGANALQGLAGSDTLDGKDGADTIEGGEGNDTLSGGGQGDVFRFAASNTGVDRILDFSKNFDRFDLSGGTFTAMSTAANGDTVLTHAGGFIRIASPPNLTLAQWNALVLPSGGRVASDGAFATTAHDASGALMHAGDSHAALLRSDTVSVAHHGEWLYI